MTQKHDGYFWKNCRQMLDERFGIGSDAARSASQRPGIYNNPRRRSSMTSFADGHILLSCGRNRRRAAARIVVAARTLRGDPGGVASYTEALIEHLPAVLPEVPIVLLRHPLNPRALSRAPNVTEWILGGKPNSPWTYFRMRSWLNARLSRDDLFHAPYRILPRGLKAKSAITIHDVMQIVCPELVFPQPVSRARL